MPIPEWAKAHQRKGTEIKQIRGHYYLYERKGVWNKVKKRSEKATGAYLGKVTPEGVIPPKKRIDGLPVLSIEYGASTFLYTLGTDILSVLEDSLGKPDGQAVFALSVMRTISPCPFSRAADRYVGSQISRLLPGLALSPASITSLLDRVGANRISCARAMRTLAGPAPYILADGTRCASASEGMDKAVPGHSKTHGYLPQINQVYVLSADASGGFMPSFYRNVAGNIPDVAAFRLTVEDAGIKNAVVVADAGFASTDNFKMLKKSGLDYVVPLKRNTAEVDLSNLCFQTVFSYNGRAISATCVQRAGYDVHVFRDESMRAQEMSDLVVRVEKANAAAEEKRDFDPRQDLRDAGCEAAARAEKFGVIVIRTSLVGRTPSEIYTTYKTRWQIEQFFDTMKNGCGADASYMHDDVGFEAWSFINHVMMLLACRLLALLRDKGLSKDWSLSGVMDYLSRVNLVHVADQWRMAETTDKTKKLLNKLGIELEDIPT